MTEPVKTGPASRSRALFAAGVSATALMLSACAVPGVQPNIRTVDRNGSGTTTTRVTSTGVSVSTRDRGGSHTEISTDPRKTCVSGGQNSRSKLGLCIDARVLGNILGGGNQQQQPAPNGGTTPSPLGPKFE